MKVLKSPADKPWQMESDCVQCGTVVELEIGDVKGHSDSREGDYVSWDCPTCRRSNTIAMKFIPPGYHHQIKY